MVRFEEDTIIAHTTNDLANFSISRYITAPEMSNILVKTEFSGGSMLFTYCCYNCDNVLETHLVSYTSGGQKSVWVSLD